MWARPPLPLPLLGQRGSQSQEPMAGEWEEPLFPGQVTALPPPRDHVAFPNSPPLTGSSKVQHGGALQHRGSHNSLSLAQRTGQGPGPGTWAGGRCHSSSPLLDRTQES